MKHILFAVLAILVLSPTASMAQVWGASPASMEARLNRDGYPYTVMNRPLLPPQEKRKLHRYYRSLEKQAAMHEISAGAQFRAMSADERRYVIQSQGYPRAVMPGIK
jgi:hypothetical protein